MAATKTKILVYTAMYNRPGISRLFATAIKRFIADAPKNVSVQVFSTVSESESMEVCMDNEFSYLYHENKPLGRKWNAGMQHCINNFGFDYALIMGDDDIISSDAWPLIMSKIKDGSDYFGFTDIYFVNSSQPKAARFSYRGKSADEKLIGCGRFISKYALVHAGFKTEIKFTEPYEHGLMRYKANDKLLVYLKYADYLVKMGKAVYTATATAYMLWDDAQDSGLDNESETNLIHAGFFPEVIETEQCMMADIKSSQNIWSYTTRSRQSIRVPFLEAISMMGQTELEQLKQFVDA